MRRRDFLKLAGASVMAPSVLASIPKQKKCMDDIPWILERPVMYDALKKKEDWVDKEMRRIYSQIDRRTKEIIISEELFQHIEFRRSLMFHDENLREQYFCGIPIFVSNHLPINKQNGEMIHAYIIDRSYFKGESIWKVGYALEYIPKNGYGWVQIKPVNPLRYYKL